MMKSGSIRYHVGYLMRDRLFDDDLDARATKMKTLSDAGEVNLVQKRFGNVEGVWEYWALPVAQRLVD